MGRHAVVLSDDHEMALQGLVDTWNKRRSDDEEEWTKGRVLEQMVSTDLASALREMDARLSSLLQVCCNIPEEAMQQIFKMLPELDRLRLEQRVKSHKEEEKRKADDDLEQSL